ncbi:MAG: hypothetical protein BWY79_00296 [Actinobacteria bacterium ADurb.Bin444]|nr:MAG: hypothetical protein BWY79_00296 [Actinobacteria bacterium ADurb.Bin444]
MVQVYTRKILNSLDGQGRASVRVGRIQLLYAVTRDLHSKISRQRKHGNEVGPRIHMDQHDRVRATVLLDPVAFVAVIRPKHHDIHGPRQLGWRSGSASGRSGAGGCGEREHTDGGGDRRIVVHTPHEAVQPDVGRGCPNTDYAYHDRHHDQGHFGPAPRARRAIDAIDSVRFFSGSHDGMRGLSQTILPCPSGGRHFNRPE